MPQKRTIPITCAACGTQFLAKGDAVKRGNVRFCSRACAAKKTGEEKRGRDVSKPSNGRFVAADSGYVYVIRPGSTPGEPRHKRYIYEHRLVAEQMLGRPLLPGEEAHHIDGNKQRNVPENIQVLTKSEHARLHQIDRPKLARWSTDYDACVICGKTEKPHSGHGWCHRCKNREYARAKAKARVAQGHQHN